MANGWARAGKPTVFLYAHHDVQPINYVEEWQSPAWTLTPRDGRLFGRGAADDKGAITAQLAALAAWLKTKGELPVNVKMVVEGEEEIGSQNLMAFFREHQKRLQSDVIVVCDTENLDTGLPSITYALRGIVAVLVEVESAKLPVHSGMAGGALADAALALNVILSRLYWGNGPLPIPHFYDKVRPLTQRERKALSALPGDEAKFREDLGILPGVRFAREGQNGVYEQTWRKPAVTVIAQEASSIKGASNQVLPRVSAIVSCRIVPDQDPHEVYEQLKAVLMADPPWGVQRPRHGAGQTGEVVDDRPDRPGLRGGGRCHETGLFAQTPSPLAAAARSVSSAPWPSCSAAHRLCLWASKIPEATPTRPTRACTKATGRA